MGQNLDLDSLRRFAFGIVLVAAASAPLLGPQSAVAQGRPDDVVARMDDEVITRAEFDKAINRVKQSRQMQVPATGAAPDELPAVPEFTTKQRLDMLDRMIDARILSMLAANSGLDVAKQKVDEAFAEIMDRLGNEPHPVYYPLGFSFGALPDWDQIAAGEKFKEFLERQNTTEEEVKENLHQKLLNTKYIEQVTKDIAVTPEEVQRLYDQLKAEGQLTQSGETYDVSHIIIKVDSDHKDQWDKAKNAIEAARKRIQKGEDFGEVAKEVSDDAGSKDRGGAYPWTPRGQMAKEFDATMANAPIGEVSEPFQTRFGWHILMVTAKNEAGVVTPLDALKPRIEAQILAGKQEAEVRRIVGKARASMKIETNLDDAANADAQAPIPIER